MLFYIRMFIYMYIRETLTLRTLDLLLYQVQLSTRDPLV